MTNEELSRLIEDAPNNNVEFNLGVIDNLITSTTIINDRISALEAVTLSIDEHNYSIDTVNDRINYLEEVMYSDDRIDSERIVNEVLHRVIKIIEDKSNWIYSPSQDEFNSSLEGLF